jgi:hypothetical protein
MSGRAPRNRVVAVGFGTSIVLALVSVAPALASGHSVGTGPSPARSADRRAAERHVPRVWDACQVLAPSGVSSAIVGCVAWADSDGSASAGARRRS